MSHFVAIGAVCGMVRGLDMACIFFPNSHLAAILRMAISSLVI